MHWIPRADEPANWPVFASGMNLERHEGYKYIFRNTKPNNVKYSWNGLVRDFLADPNNEWLFSTHADVQYAPRTLKRLLSWGKPLVSALVFMRQNPVQPHIWKRYNDDDQMIAMRVQETRDWFCDHRELIRPMPIVSQEIIPDALVEIDYTSTSCVLIHRKVLEAIEPPWFLWDDDENGGGEDRFFFEKAKAAGFQGYVDRSCVVGHGEPPTCSEDFMGWDSRQIGG